MRRVVIVGASLAGLRAAQAARAGGFDGELVVVGEERSPAVHAAAAVEGAAGRRARGGSRRCSRRDTFDAQWRLGVSATSLDRARRRVVLSDGDELAVRPADPRDRLPRATLARRRRRTGRRPRPAQPRRRARAAGRARAPPARRDRGRGLHRLRGRPDRAQAGPRRDADRRRADADAAAGPAARRMVRRAAPRQRRRPAARNRASPRCTAPAASRRSS